MRSAKVATVFWGRAQIGVALAAQYVTKSVLDSGLGVLSLAAGPVLGAFLCGVLGTDDHVRSGDPARCGPSGGCGAVVCWRWGGNG